MQYLKDEIREKILSSALIEFNEHGYLKASMRDIASDAGISLGSTYRYFHTKNALFNALIGPVHDEILVYLLKISSKIQKTNLEENANYFEYIHDLYYKIVDLVQEYRVEIRILFNNSEGTKFENMKQEVTNFIYNLLSKTCSNKISQNINNKIILSILSSNLVEGISVIFKEEYDGITTKWLINKLLVMYLKDIEERLSYE
ncbi:MAG: TetR/AcrR family transcriptional regulator [Clostridium sp.]|nr:TetR/AcrR family transcriptional regulator [Clostridium sp.]